jgi:hypothetical protein
MGRLLLIWVRHAKRYVAYQFATDKSVTVTDLSLKSLYLLAAPSTPDHPEIQVQSTALADPPVPAQPADGPTAPGMMRDQRRLDHRTRRWRVGDRRPAMRRQPRKALAFRV